MTQLSLPVRLRVAAVAASPGALPLLPRRRRRHPRAARRRRPGALRQPRLRGQRAAPCEAVADPGRPRRCRCYASVHRGAGYLSQVSHRALRGGPGDRRARSSAPAPTTSCDLHPQHHRRAQPAGRRACRPASAVLVLDIEHHAEPAALAARRGPAPTRAAHRGARVAETLRAAGAPSWRAGRYALVAVTGASNVTGEALPLDEVVALAHAARRPGRGRRRAAGAAPPVLPRRVGRRLRRVLRAQDLRAVRRRRAGRPRATGWTPPRRTWPAAARCARCAVERDRLGRGARTGTRPARPTCSARSRWPRRARRWPRCPPGRSPRTSGRCARGSSPGWRAIAGVEVAADLAGLDRARSASSRSR